MNTRQVFDVRKDANGGLGMGVEGRGQEGQPGRCNMLLEYDH